MSFWNSIFNPIKDIENIAMGTVHLFTEPAVQIHKYIEPAVISAIPAVAAAGACLTGVLCAPAIMGAVGTYGAQLSTQGVGGLLGGKRPLIGDFAIGAGAAGGAYGIEAFTSASVSAPLATGYNIFNPAATAGTATNIATAGTTAGTAASNSLITGNFGLTSLGSTTAGTAATTSGGLLSSVGSALGSGLSDTLGALSTVAQTLSVAATGMEAYSLISSRNASGATAGQCNNVQSMASQFSNDSTQFNSLISGITSSNAQQTLSQMQSIYSNANQVGSSIISSGSSCVDSTVANQIQQTLSSMQQEISQLESDLGLPNTTSAATTSTTPAATTTAGATSSTVSSTCSNNHQPFCNLVTQFNQALQSGQTAAIYSTLLGYYQQAQGVGQQISVDSICGTSSVMGIVNNNLTAMANAIQQLGGELSAAGISTSQLSPSVYSSSSAVPYYAQTGTTPTTAATTANTAIQSTISTYMPEILIGGAALIGGIILYAI
jgi:hypothetical protein